MHLFRQRTLPPSLPEAHGQSVRPACTLSSLVPQAYVDTTARVVTVRSKEKEDEIGKRPCVFGILEDRTFRAPFISYKPLAQFDRDSVFRFSNAYVHEFEDESLLLILTEYSRVAYAPEEDPAEYFWRPGIGEIARPLGFCRVTLEGVVSKISSSSGLIKRCEKCGRVLYEGTCPEGHKEGSYWDMRIAGMISDSTGSINIIFSKYLTSKILNRPISEILLAANIEGPTRNGCEFESFELEAPQDLSVNEALVVDDPYNHRSSDKLIVSDGTGPRIFYPPSTNVDPKGLIDVRQRVLGCSREDDRRLILRLVERALDLRIRNITGQARLHGIYLFEKPTDLYRCEEAKLFCGFEVDVSYSSPTSISVEVYPEALIRESVLDFIDWKRRFRGSSAQSIKRLLTTHRSNALTAPNGTLARITDVLFEEAGNFSIPGSDITLPEFWKTVYDIDVDPREKPLLVLKPYSLDIPLTYPPSCVFFDEQSIWTGAGVLRFVNYKKREARSRALRVVSSALQDLSVGEAVIKSIGEGRVRFDARRQILREIREKLLGRTVKASGSIARAGGRFYFFPRTVEGVS